MKSCKKNLFFTFCFLIFSCTYGSEQINPTISSKSNDPLITNDPLLIIVLMVKNEAEVIRETLKPFVEPFAQEIKKQLSFFVFDTGSTDSTMALAEQYFKEKNVIDFVIKQEPFVDFATSRNRGLDLAEQAFPNATFMLMPDAEWYMNNVEELVKFCVSHKNDFATSYLVRIMNSSIDFYTRRLIRCKRGVGFVGAVHEDLNQCWDEKVPADCFFFWDPKNYGIEKSRRRWQRDLDLLLKEFIKNPQSTRTAFYIAQTYACLGDLKNARLWYALRANMQGWDEENFMAHYRLAQVWEDLGDWDCALREYLKAYSMRPSRVEPLIRLAQHYFKTNEMALCYLFSSRAAQIPYPENDTLFIDKDLYEYTRYDLLGICAWYVGEYKVGQEAVMMALKAHPDYPHLYKNAAFYSEKLNSKIKEVSTNISAQ
jgi:tetratricopeptide (TPR) repeat protein